MAKNVVVTMTIAANSQANNFTIRDNFGTILATNVAKATLVAGTTISVADTVTSITVDSTGICTTQDTANIVPLTNTYNIYTADSYMCPNCTLFQSNIIVSVPTSITVNPNDFVNIGDGMAYQLKVYQSTGTGTGTLLIGGVVAASCTVICAV
jgi:hypothetical protein